MAAHPFDIDDVATWPAAVLAYADEWARALWGTTTYATDLDVPLEDADGFRHLFRGHCLRAIHCTRLLGQERVSIRERGLRVASPELVADCICGAYEAGEITGAMRDSLLTTHAFAAGTPAAGARTGQVCFIASQQLLEYRPSNVEPLLRTWGGEVIYKSRSDRTRLRLIGRPALIVSAIDVAADPEPPTRHLFMPELNKLFVAARLELEIGGDIRYRSPVPPKDVLAILQPGDAAYDRHSRLPRA